MNTQDCFQPNKLFLFYQLQQKIIIDICLMSSRNNSNDGELEKIYFTETDSVYLIVVLLKRG
jgi:hypothetical protein